MPMIVGDTDATTGLAKRIRDGMLADARTQAVDSDALRALAHVIAAAVIAEITTNATITVTTVTACGSGAGTGNGTGVIT